MINFSRKGIVIQIYMTSNEHRTDITNSISMSSCHSHMNDVTRNVLKHVFELYPFHEMYR